MKDADIEWYDYCRLRVEPNLPTIKPIFATAVLKNDARETGSPQERRRTRTIWKIAEGDLNKKFWWRGKFCYDPKNPGKGIYREREAFLKDTYKFMAELSWFEILTHGPSPATRGMFIKEYIGGYLERGGAVEEAGIPRAEYRVAKKLLRLEELTGDILTTIVIPLEKGTEIDPAKVQERLQQAARVGAGIAAMSTKIKSPRLIGWLKEVNTGIIELALRVGKVKKKP